MLAIFFGKFNCKLKIILLREQRIGLFRYHFSFSWITSSDMRDDVHHCTGLVFPFWSYGAVIASSFVQEHTVLRDVYHPILQISSIQYYLGSNNWAFLSLEHLRGYCCHQVKIGVPTQEGSTKKRLSRISQTSSALSSMSSSINIGWFNWSSMSQPKVSDVWHWIFPSLYVATFVEMFVFCVSL